MILLCKSRMMQKDGVAWIWYLGCMGLPEYHGFLVDLSYTRWSRLQRGRSIHLASLRVARILTCPNPDTIPGRNIAAGEYARLPVGTIDGLKLDKMDRRSVHGTDSLI